VTPQWRIGGDVIAVSSQFVRGDEGNDDRPLPGHAVVNLRTGYKVTDNVEIYAQSGSGTQIAGCRQCKDLAQIIQWILFDRSLLYPSVSAAMDYP
jgi:hypothetical protein